MIKKKTCFVSGRLALHLESVFKKIKKNFCFKLIFLMFSDYFNVLILKIIFKK